MNFYCSYNREHLCMAKSLQETREIFSICQKFQSQRVYMDTSLYSMGSEDSEVPGTSCTSGEHHEWPRECGNCLGTSRQLTNFTRSHEVHVNLRKFTQNKTKGSSDLIKALFLIEITQPRVPAIAPNFLKLTFTCISTNSRKPILRSSFQWFGNCPSRSLQCFLSGFGAHQSHQVT